MSPPKFNGPASNTLAQFIKTVDSIPPCYAAAFNSISVESVAIMTNKSYLHVWETDSDIDSLIQLTQVIVKIRHMYTIADGGKSIPAATVIVVDEERGRDNFGRVCEVVKGLIGKEGRPHMHGSLVSYGGVRVVRGFDNSTTPDEHGKYPDPAASAMNRAVDRISKTLARVLTCGAFTPENRKIIWHHGPVIHSLNYFINNTTSEVRSAFAAVSVVSAINLTAPRGFKPHRASRNRNSVHDFARLESYLTRLGIFATLADPQSQFIEYAHLNTYMYFYAFYLSAFLPTADLIRPHWDAALDALVTYCFRLHNAAAGKRKGPDVVKLVQKHLPHKAAKPWARTCVKPESYGSREICQATASDSAIHTAVQLADAPFQLFKAEDFPVDPLAHGKKNKDASGKKEDIENVGLTAFARLTFGPAADLLAEHYVCAPTALSFTPSSSNPNPDPYTPHIRISPAHPSPFRLFLPKPAQDVNTVTQRIRGVMLGVLELVRKSYPAASTPKITPQQREQWDAVAKACQYALEGCKSSGNLPPGVWEKAKFVEEKAGSGTWCFALAWEAKMKDVGGNGCGVGGGMGAGGFGNGQMGGFGPGGQMGGQQPVGGGVLQGGYGGPQNGYGVPNGQGFPQGPENAGVWPGAGPGAHWS